MNKAVFLLFSLLVVDGSQQILQRRQAVSYSSSVIHQDPKFPDQSAESSVKVILNPSTSESTQHNSKIPSPYGNIRLKPQTAANKPSSINNDQSQSFNVGYSVSFMNGIPTTNQQQTHQFITRQKNLDDGGEIITGTRKRNEEVQVPHFDSTHAFASNSLFDNNQKKLADIKLKNQYFGESMAFPNTNFLLNQANLSPATQKNFQLLEQIKPNNNQLNQNLALQKHYSWRNLSPSVEIIRSTEIPINQKLIEQQSSKFNHEKALGHSQGFDYSNAMDQPSNLDSQHTHQTSSFFNHFNNLKNSPLAPQNLVPSNNGGGLKFPIDTRLLREPILSSDIKSGMSDQSVIPIHYDTRLLKQVMKNQLAPYQVQKLAQVPQDNYIEPHPTQQSASSSQFRVVHEPYNSQQLSESNLGTQTSGFQDYQGPKNKQQYKIYGKPQPIRGLSGFNGGGGGGGFGPPPPQGFDFNQQRQPRYSIGDYNLQRNLTPPPFAKYHFQRRMYIGF